MAETHRPAHAAESHVPHEEFVDNDERLKIVITGLDEPNLHTYAAEAADKQMTDTLNEHGGGFRGFVKKMWRNTWHGNIMRDYYLDRWQKQHTQKIVESGDLEQHLDTDARTQDLALEETKRWAQAYDENLRQDLLSEEEAETFGLVLDKNPDGSTNPEGAHLKGEITELVEDFVSGRIPDEDAFNEAAKRLLNDAAQSGAHANMIGRAQLRISNLFQVAQNVQAIQMREQALGNDKSVKDIMKNADIIMGSAKIGPETKLHLNRVERTVEKLRRVPILNTINEGTLATAASVIYSVGGWATKTAAGAAGAVVAAGATAGIWAGFREARRLKDERVQHTREMVRGDYSSAQRKTDQNGNVLEEVFDLPTAEDMAKRRAEIEETRYESKSATELMEQLGLLYEEDGEFRVKDGDTFKQAVQIIAEIEARNRISSQREIDLIHFSKGKISRERRLLRGALAKAKVDLRHVLEESDPALLAQFGIDAQDLADFQTNNPNSNPIDLILDPIRDGNEGVLDLSPVAEIDEDIKAKDRLYRRLRTKRVAGAVAKGTLLGVGIGGAVQELVIAPLSGNTQGALESALGGGNPAEASRETLLQSLVGPEPVEMSPHYATVDIPGTPNKMTLPDNMGVTKNPDGTFTLSGDGITAENLTVNADGSLTPDTQMVLREAGFSVDPGHVEFGPPQLIEHEVNAQPRDILENHKNETVRVTRDHWYDNDTPMHWEGGKLRGADHNELGLWDPVRNANGDIKIRTNMTESGSWTAGERANWEELARKGDLQVALSLSKGTQNHVFMVPINANGEAVIKADSPVANFFTEGRGEVKFMGKYTEVVEIRGVDANGKTHIAPLATDIGQGRNRIPDIVTETKPTPHTVYAVEYQPNKDPVVAVPPVLPWYPRKGLEIITPNPNTTTVVPPPEVESTPYYLGGYFDVDPVTRQRYLDRMSPRLRDGNDPDAELDEREETEWYWNSLPEAHRDRITDLIEQADPMSPTTEIVVAIPVAGHQEQDNIYRTLSAYLNQSLDKNKFEIMLYVNHPETDASGNPTSAQATLDEIARFRQDHPDMPIRVLYEALPRSEAKIGFIRKVLNDAIVKRSLDRTATPGADVIIVSNDADTISMSDIYLENFVDRFRANPDIDAMLGQLDWDNDAYLRYPAMHVATRLFLYDEIMKRRGSDWIASSGANFSLLLKNFAAVGGYDSTQSICEDVELGRALKVARSGAKKKKAVGFAGNKPSRLETSARRAAYVYETFEDAPYNQWSYSFSADDDAVRTFTVTGDLPDMSDPATRTKITESTQIIVNKTLANLMRGIANSATTGNSFQQYVERSLRFCGLEFYWNTDGKSITITDATRMFEGLEAFKARMLAKGRGPAPAATAAP